MLNKSHLSQLAIVYLALLAGLPISCSQVNSQEIPYSPSQDFEIAAQIGAKSVKVADLADDNYQFCSQSAPQDWRDGAGVCFVFAKIGNRVDGYYGYPHSDDFICLRGKVDGNRIAGEALAISWAVHQQNQIPESAFHWDSEKRLTISQGNIIRTTKDGEDPIEWIFYRNALLNIDGFYQYNRPRMTTASQLCKWNLTAAG
ncbi:MAG: hypothetical protein RMX68_017295 [Aulosira sp. ZfuVER01]|nr:hypothetical protein [Aulosira sp. ZfuVER01]MDZ7997323.1 hypothetical protein [Aulosira sp. DedVER01a]MDZ8054156.1 hypothetical protein [Aulosira sp. ZfuCHP01]